MYEKWKTGRCSLRVEKCSQSARGVVPGWLEWVTVGIKPCACVSVSVCLCFFLKSRQELRLSIQSVDSAAPSLANEDTG